MGYVSFREGIHKDSLQLNVNHPVFPWRGWFPRGSGIQQILQEIIKKYNMGSISLEVQPPFL